METYEFRQDWSVAKIRGTRKLRRRRPRKVVCLREKGTSETRREKKTKEGEKVAPAKERFRVSSTEKFLFLVNEYLGSERPVSFE